MFDFMNLTHLKLNDTGEGVLVLRNGKDMKMESGHCRKKLITREQNCPNRTMSNGAEPLEG